MPLVQLPELVGFVLGEQLVVRVFKSGGFKWFVPGVKDEQRDTKGEQVDNLALVASLHVDFWCHVAICAHSFFVQSVALLALDRAGKSEIYHLQVKVLIDHQIFKFQVAICNSTSVHIVQDIKKLSSKISGQTLFEWSALAHLIKHVTVWQEFEDQVSDALLRPIRFVVLSLWD